MLTEQYKDLVYFSGWLRSYYPGLYKELVDILDSNQVKHGVLPLTEDYGCRDYMPIQWGHERGSQYIYNPDYLKDLPQYLTDADKVMKSLKTLPMRVEKYPIVVDGGNMVFCEGSTSSRDCKKHYVVMTDKVMLENPGYTRSEIESVIKESFHCKDLEIVWLPWNHSDMCGHTDGILRYVGINDSGIPIVLVNLSLYEKDHAVQMCTVLKDKFEVVNLELSEYTGLSWAYINCLQTRDVIIVPGIGNPKTDREALEQIKRLYPQYGDKVYQVQMKSFIKRGGGALNCCTWTVSEDMSDVVHNGENDKRYAELVMKARKSEDLITKEDRVFLGDYYPLRLKKISRQLDKWYYGY